MLSHGNLLASVEALRIAWRWTPDDRLVLALPLFHMHGLVRRPARHAAARRVRGAAPALRRRRRARRGRDEHGATLFFGVPTMYSRLAASDRARRAVAGCACACRARRRSADLHARARRRVGTRVLERYGMTETLMNVSNPYDGDRRPGTVGIPLPLRRRRRSSAGTDGDLRARPQRVRRLLAAPRRHRGVVHRTAGSPPATSARGTTTATSRIVGRAQGAHHQRRLQRVPARGRGRARSSTRASPRSR